MEYLLERYRLSHSKSANYVKFGAGMLFVLFSLKVSAQQVSWAVLNGWGETIKLNGNTYDASIGEAAITTLKSEQYIITQGFLQPIDLKVPCGEVQLRAYPNPVVGGMRIYAEGCDVDVATVQAFDLFGKLVYEGEPLDNKVDFTSIGVGVYLIRALDANDEVLGVVKVIKTTI